jgi:threonine synthase
MDISKASNFERFVFDLLDRDAERVSALWEELARTGQFDLSGTPEFASLAGRFGFVSARSSHAERLATIRATLHETGVMVDPHTADGLNAARAFHGAGPMIVLETALPAKFAATIEAATGVVPERPARFVGLEERPQRYVVLPASVEKVKDYIARHSGLA